MEATICGSLSMTRKPTMALLFLSTSAPCARNQIRPASCAVEIIRSSSTTATSGFVRRKRRWSKNWTRSSRLAACVHISPPMPPWWCEFAPLHPQHWNSPAICSPCFDRQLTSLLSSRPERLRASGDHDCQHTRIGYRPGRKPTAAGVRAKTTPDHAGVPTLSAELPCLSLLFTLLFLLFLCIAVDHNGSDEKPCLCRARRHQLQIMLLDNRRGISRLIGHLVNVFVDGNASRNASMPQHVLLPLDTSILGDLLLEPVKEAVAARPDRFMRPDVWIQPLGQRVVDRDGPPAVRLGDPSFQVNDPVRGCYESFYRVL